MNNLPPLVGKPRIETAVYLLLGMLWQYIPHRFTFVEFEVSPRKQKYGHTKFLDARGKEWIEGQWKDVTFEFKVSSKGILSDIVKHPKMHADWLICWEHDAPTAEKYVDRVLCLKDIFDSLDDDEKSRIIGSSPQSAKNRLAGTHATSCQRKRTHSHPALYGRPSAESTVYFLLGMLWDHIPYRFFFEEFEVSPTKQNYDHTKVLDARGKEQTSLGWEDVTFEFKLSTSGIFSDLRSHPTFNATWFVCWDHEAPAAERYVKRILALKDIFMKLPSSEQNLIIGNPDEVIKVINFKSTLEELVSQFSEHNQAKVVLFIRLWKFTTRAYQSEIVLLKEGNTMVRINAYSGENIFIKATIPDQLHAKLIDKYGADPYEVNYKLKIQLKSLNAQIIEEIIYGINSRLDQLANFLSHEPSVRHSFDLAPMEIVGLFKLLGVIRKSGAPGTPVSIKWQYNCHIVELRYLYKAPWIFEGYYLNGSFVPLPKKFSSRDSARNCYLQDAFSRALKGKAEGSALERGII